MSYKKISIPILMISLPFIFFDVLLPVYTEELGYTTFQFTLLVSVFSFAQLFMRLLLGKISDKYSRRSIFIASLLFFVGAYFTFALADQLLLLMSARVLNGIANILLTLAVFGMIADGNTNLAQQLGRFDSNRNLGGLIGIGLCFYILTNYELLNGWKVLFTVCGAVALLSLLFSLLLRTEDSNQEMNPQIIVLTPEKRKIWTVNVIFRLISSMVIVLLIPYLQDVFDADIEEIALTFLLPLLISSFSGTYLGKLGDRLGYRKAVIVSTAMSVITVAALLFSPRLSLFALVWTFFILSFSMLEFSLDAMFMKGIYENNTGNAYGKYSAGSNIGMIVGPALGGYLFDSFGHAAPYIVFVGGMTTLIPLLLLMLPPDSNTIDQDTI
ncbi:MFS transporter [Paenibacillus sp. GCM10012306]|uniref:MFS transporter n=1 Tax=Paenibacillus sp. GCM10012306 TaxID=3317342 RepID=UPI00360B23BE